MADTDEFADEGTTARSEEFDESDAARLETGWMRLGLESRSKHRSTSSDSNDRNDVRTDCTTASRYPTADAQMKGRQRRPAPCDVSNRAQSSACVWKGQMNVGENTVFHASVGMLVTVFRQRFRPCLEKPLSSLDKSEWRYLTDTASIVRSTLGGRPSGGPRSTSARPPLSPHPITAVCV